MTKMRTKKRKVTTKKTIDHQQEKASRKNLLAFLFANKNQKSNPIGLLFMELVIRIELMTSSLPMTGSTD